MSKTDQAYAVLRDELVKLKTQNQLLESERDRAIESLGVLAMEKARLEKRLWTIRRDVS
jgi:hypothetical protein